MKKVVYNRKSSVEIIIVKYNVPDFERNTIKSVLDNTSEPYNLTAWQNRAKDENLSVIWNKLIKRSTADYICLLNTDVKVTPDWLDDLLEVFEKEKNVGIVSCVTNACGIVKQRQPVLSKYKVEESSQLSGFCMVFPKKLWKKVGGFDEEYELYGEDSQLCVDVIKLGYRLLIRRDVFIHHFKGQSSIKARCEGKDTLAIAAKSARMFTEKTKIVPEYLRRKNENNI